MKKRPELRIVADYMMIDGEAVKVDPLKTDLPDRCKLAWTEINTGIPCEIVNRVKEAAQ